MRVFAWARVGTGRRLGALSAALVLSTSLTAPVLAADQTLSGTLTGPITVNAPIDTLTNVGTITANSGGGALVLGGNPSRFKQVINTGEIIATGTTAGIAAGVAIESFLNSGAIVSEALGMYYGGLYTGSMITNAQGGLIEGDLAAFQFYYGIDTFVNAGTLRSTAGTAFQVTNGSIFGFIGTFTNTATGEIYGRDTAVSFDKGVATFENYGLIQSTGGSGYGFHSNADVTTFTNATGATIAGSTGAYIAGSVTGIFRNDGRIEATSSSGDGVAVDGSTASFINGANGVIVSNRKAVDLDGTVDNFLNQGRIEADYRAIDFDSHVTAFVNEGTIANVDSGVAIDALTFGTFTNSGTITSAATTNTGAIYVSGDVQSFTNSGTITANSTNTYALSIGGTVGTFRNESAGVITSADGGVLLSGAVTSFFNAGQIDAADEAGVEFGNTVGTFTNVGTIRSAADDGVAFWNDVETFANAGSIFAANDQAVYFDRDVTNFTNYAGGELSGAEYGVWVDDGSIESFNNAGTINGDGRAVSVSEDVGTFTNSGRLIGVNEEAVYIGNEVGSFTNAATGVIEGVGDAVMINGDVGTFTNRGRIASADGTGAGVYFDDTVGSFTNGGTIESAYGYGVYVGMSAATFVNEASGTIRGIDAAVYLNEGGTGAIENRGTLTGNVGLIFGGYGSTAATVINSGTIEGTGGTAIDFGTGGSGMLDDVLQLRTGSRILGRVAFDNGNDTLDVSGFQGNAILTVASLETVISGDRLVSQNLTSGSGTVSIVDASGITGGGSTVMGEVAGAIGGEIAGALGGIAGRAGPVEPMGYAPARPLGAAEAAADELVASAASTGPEIWGKAFGGIANRGNDYSAVLGGIVAGSHAAVGANTRLGGVVSVSGSRFATVGGQTITSNIGAAGFYGSTGLGDVTLSYSVLAGVAGNHSERTVTALVTETARADYASWFLSPELGVAIPLPLLDGVDTAAGFKVRYVGGGVGSYTETGSSQNLSVGTSAVNLLDARMEFTGTAQLAANDHGDVTLSATAGVLAQHNFGSAVSIAGFPIAATPASFAYGAYGDVSLQAPIGPTSTLSASTGVEVRSDGASSASANLGLSATF